VGFYRDRVFTPAMDRLMDTAETRRIRRSVCAPLHGRVLEIGFGTGHNLPFLPPAVTEVLAVEPLVRSQELAADRIAASDATVEFVGLDGQDIALDDATADSALCTWTLCSIDDPVAAVREVRRVLKPGGWLHVVEHGRSPDEAVRRWQHRLTPLQRRVACGCRFDRDIPHLLDQGGMAVQGLTTYCAAGDPKILGWTFQGRATPV
jgi:ubiquinone/menaquinone biosynthesis C-methylase UbiE